jgi:hypothetical protein
MENNRTRGQGSSWIVAPAEEEEEEELLEGLRKCAGCEANSLTTESEDSEERIASIFGVEKFRERGTSVNLRNVVSHKIYMAPHPRRRHYS